VIQRLCITVSSVVSDYRLGLAFCSEFGASYTTEEIVESMYCFDVLRFAQRAKLKTDLRAELS
jgi:hypothetical protein